MQLGRGVKTSNQGSFEQAQQIASRLHVSQQPVFHQIKKRNNWPWVRKLIYQIPIENCYKIIGY